MNDGRRTGRMIPNTVIPVICVSLVCFLGPKLLKFFMPLVIGWFIAMTANPLVRLLERRLKTACKHSSVIIVVVMLTLVIGLLYLAIFRIAIETVELAKDLPRIYELVQVGVQGAFADLGHLASCLPQGMQDTIFRINGNLGDYISDLVQKAAFLTVTVAGNVVKRTPVALVYSIVVTLSSYFFIVEREQILRFWRRMAPEGLLRYYDFSWQDVKKLIGGYFLAQFRITFVAAGISMVGFVVLGVPYGLLLTILIAILDFLLLFGMRAALFPWAFVKLLTGEYSFVVGLVLLYALTQVVRQIIQSRIVGDSIGPPSLMTLLFLYLGFKTNGISGIVLTVPIGIIGSNLYKYGASDSLIENVRLLAVGIQRFRKQD